MKKSLPKKSSDRNNYLRSLFSQSFCYGFAPLIEKSIIFGILSMMGWGVSDFVITILSRSIGSLRTLFWMSLGRSALMVAYPILFHISLPCPSLKAVSILFLSGLLQAAGSFAFYRALRVGKVSLASPIAASWAMWTIILSLIFLGESLSKTQSLSICLIMLGSVFISTNFKQLAREKQFKLSDPGIEYALLASVFWGTSFVFYSSIVHQYGWLLPVIMFNVFIFLNVSIFCLVLKNNVAFQPIPKHILLCIAMSFMDVLAYFAYSNGVKNGFTAIVSPIASTAPLATILLACLFLKERLVWNQLVGIFGIITGIVLLSLT